MATRTKVRGNGSVNVKLSLFLNELKRLKLQVSEFIGDNKTRTFRDISGEVGRDLLRELASVSADMADLQQIACKAIIRSVRQDTAIGGSRTRRRRADGSITGS